MPVIEKVATVDSASTSTAPIFKTMNDFGVSGLKDGQAKTFEKGWWCVFEHNSGRNPALRSSWAQSTMWGVWLAAFGLTCCIPSLYFKTFNACVIGLILVSIVMPDQGDTVFPFYSIVILPIVVFKTVSFGGLWSFGILGYVFLVIPFFDWFVGVDVGNQTREIQRELHNAFRFQLLTFLVAPLVLGCLWYGATWVNDLDLSLCQWLGLIIGQGIIEGVIGIVAGHELCHKANAFERGLGRLLMCAGSYGHFYIEHTLGHHKDVATDKDAASARYGENFYEFLPRCVIGEFRSACHIESARLKRYNLPWWHNEIPAYFLCSAALCMFLAMITGPMAIPFFIGQSVVAILLFESVNYLEHYGLERKEVKPGQYEPVAPQHSWDTPARITNHVMFKLQRHADHHAHAGKRFQTLQCYDTSPQLPAGYATMILLAFIPPLWEAVMHPRLMAHRKQQNQVFRWGPTPEQTPVHKKKKLEEPNDDDFPEPAGGYPLPSKKYVSSRVILRRAGKTD